MTESVDENPANVENIPIPEIAKHEKALKLLSFSAELIRRTMLCFSRLFSFPYFDSRPYKQRLYLFLEFHTQ